MEKINQKDIKNFNKAVESLRLYQRYEILDDKKKDMLNRIYVDPIEGDALLKLCLKDNTTVLIGRKGTGKSTIFMRMQNELRKSKDIMTCYIDVKTIFETAKRNYTSINYLKGLPLNKKECEYYSIQRQFILDFISELINEIDKNYMTILDRLPIESRTKVSIKKLNEIKERIKNNNHMEHIELEMLQSVGMEENDSLNTEKAEKRNGGITTKVGSDVISGGIDVSSECGETRASGTEKGKKYTRVFAKIFEITKLIEEIKDILKSLDKKKLFLILDDYSEIDSSSLELFCDLIVNPLNNLSDNYIKLKISAYPGRVDLGEMDRQKIDIRYLDYYRLYAVDKRDDMESLAVNYTKRLIEKRIKVFTGKTADTFFDTEKADLYEYYKTLFYMTFNVVRHVGLVLDYAQDYSISKGEKITLQCLNDAAKRFYVERLSQFFEESKSAKMAYDERIEKFQLRELLKDIVKREKEIKTMITTNVYTAQIFDDERTNPYTSHFYVSRELDNCFATLELNFFVSKYNEMTSKKGNKVSIYALNYGLCQNENIRWGKPEGNKHRTYFIETPFNFDSLLTDFLRETSENICTKCGELYDDNTYHVIIAYGNKCLKCGGEVVKRKIISESFRKELEIIQNREDLLEKDQFSFMALLNIKKNAVTAKEMAQEMDVSHQKIGRIAKKLIEDYLYITKTKTGSLTSYCLTKKGRDYLVSRSSRIEK